MMNLSTTDQANGSLANVTSPVATMTSSTAHKVISSIAISTLILLSVSGNALVIASFYMYKRIRRSVTNCFIVSLAVSDLMVAFLSEPFWLSFEITQWQHLPAGWNLTALVMFWMVLDIVCAVSSIANLMFISMDRYFAIKSPLSHHTKMTTSTSKWIILGLWLYALGTGCVGLVEWEWKFLLIFIIGFLVPLIIMIFCYAGILVVVTSKARLSNRVGRRLDKEFKTAKSLGVVTGSFVLCWLPFFIVSLAHKYCGSCQVAIENVPAAASAVKWLHYLNSCLNPIIYAFLNPTFKVAFRNLFRKLCFNAQNIERDNSFSFSFRQPTKRRATKTTSLRRSSNKGEKGEKNGKIKNGVIPDKKTRTNGRKLRFKTPLEESFQDSSSTDKGNDMFRAVNPDDSNDMPPCLPPRPKELKTALKYKHCTEDESKRPLVSPMTKGWSPDTKGWSHDTKGWSQDSSVQSIPKDNDSILSDSNNNPGDGSSEKLIPKLKDYTSLDSLPITRGDRSPACGVGGSLDLLHDQQLSDTTDFTDSKSLDSAVFDTQITTFVDEESNQCYLLVDGQLIPDTDIKTSNV